MTPTDQTPAEQATPAPAGPPPTFYKASELRRMPKAERDAILARAAELAREDYLNDPELTAFEAFGPEDLHVDSADTQPG